MKGPVPPLLLFPEKRFSSVCQDWILTLTQLHN